MTVSNGFYSRSLVLNVSRTESDLVKYFFLRDWRRETMLLKSVYFLFYSVRTFMISGYRYTFNKASELILIKAMLRSKRFYWTNSGNLKM